MSKFQKYICLIIAIILVVSASLAIAESTIDSFLTQALESDADAIIKIIYLEAQLRQLRDVSYDIYWNGKAKDWETALYTLSNDCEYLSQIADGLYYELYDKVR